MDLFSVDNLWFLSQYNFIFGKTMIHVIPSHCKKKLHFKAKLPHVRQPIMEGLINLILVILKQRSRL